MRHPAEDREEEHEKEREPDQFSEEVSQGGHLCGELLDEAFEGLAPAVVTRFAEAVARIKGLGISLLIAESNIMTASRVAERLYVMDRGEILFEGTPSDAFANQEVMRTIRG